MDEFKFKAGDTVRRVGEDNGVGAFGAARIGQVAKVVEVRRAATGSEYVIVIYDGHVDYAGNGGELWYAENAELVPFEIPASPFYVSVRKLYSPERFAFRVDVDGLRFKATAVGHDGLMHCPSFETREIPGYFSSGQFQLIDPPTTAVDPVVAATAEVQRLLREYQAAVKAGDEADAVAEKAAENRRNIGKQLEAAKRELEKANHEAVGIEYSDKFGANYSR